MSGYDRRGAVIGVLTAGLVCSGGVAAAAPPEDRGPTRSTDGSAFAVLSSAEEPQLGIILDVFDPQDQAPFSGLDVFFGAYECQTDANIPANLDGVESAAVEGTLQVTCGGEGLPEVTGYAEVDLQWEGEGRIRRSTVAGRFFCVSRTEAREADVTGTVRLVIEALEVDAVATPEFGELRQTRSICPPSRG